MRSIDNFNQFKSRLQSANHLKNIERFIPTISSLKSREVIAELLEKEDEDVRDANEEWLKMQESWASVPEVKKQRIDKIKENEQLFRKYLSDKNIFITPHLEQRIKRFFEYSSGFWSDPKLPILMQEFCQYVILLDKSPIGKIKECLFEFPPSNNYLLCLPGTRNRLQQQIRNLLLPRGLQMVFEAGTIAVQSLVETVSVDVRDGDRIHTYGAMEYCFGLKPKAAIRDEFFTTPRTDLKAKKMLQANHDFAVKFKEFLLQKYREYNGAIDLFAEFENIDKIEKDAACETGLYDGYDDLTPEEKAKIKKMQKKSCNI